MLSANDPGVGVGRTAEPYTALQHHMLQLLGEVHMQQAGVQAATVEGLNDREGVLLGHHVDKAVIVHNDDIDDVAKAREQAPDVGSIHRAGNMVDVDREKL